MLLVIPVGYATWFCKRNNRIGTSWENWTRHLSGPPSSWSKPSNNLYRFQGESSQSSKFNGNDVNLFG